MDGLVAKPQHFRWREHLAQTIEIDFHLPPSRPPAARR
jgi:hypothetical protein